MDMKILEEISCINQELSDVKLLLINLIELVKLETTLDKYKIGCKMGCVNDCSSID